MPAYVAPADQLDDLRLQVQEVGRDSGPQHEVMPHKVKAEYHGNGFLFRRTGHGERAVVAARPISFKREA